jgi:hypothetical protein
MIDVNLNDLRIMPADHIALKDSAFTEATQKENSDLKKIMLVMVLVGVIVAIINLKKEYNKSRESDFIKDFNEYN